MFLFQSPSIFPLNRYGTCIGFVWLFEQDVDEGGDVGGVDDGVAVDVAGVFVVRLFGAENHIDEMVMSEAFTSPSPFTSPFISGSSLISKNLFQYVSEVYASLLPLGT